MRQQIKITKRSEDFHAHLGDETEVWGYGPSIDAAIGDLIRSYPERFGIHVWYGTQFDERTWKPEEMQPRHRV